MLKIRLHSFLEIDFSSLRLLNKEVKPVVQYFISEL